MDTFSISKGIFRAEKYLFACKNVFFRQKYPFCCMETLYFLLDKCLYDVQYIVSEFFALAYHVHIIDSVLILVEFVVDIFNIP